VIVRVCRRFGRGGVETNLPFTLLWDLMASFKFRFAIDRPLDDFDELAHLFACSDFCYLVSS
jgi:hypothetical protein